MARSRCWTFGLAKAFGAVDDEHVPPSDATVTSPAMTLARVILGTADWRSCRRMPTVAPSFGCGRSTPSRPSRSTAPKGRADPWSPDSQSLAFTADGRLKKIAASGGTVVTLAAASGLGGAWGDDGTIIYNNQGAQELFRVK